MKARVIKASNIPPRRVSRGGWRWGQKYRSEFERAIRLRGDQALEVTFKSSDQALAFTTHPKFYRGDDNLKSIRRGRTVYVTRRVN